MILFVKFLFKTDIRNWFWAGAQLQAGSGSGNACDYNGDAKNNEEQ